jgi:phage terminase small subunit
MTPKQQAFVREYLVDLDATKAARRVGYKGDHVKKTASELMAKPEIRAAIAKGVAKRAERVEDSADEVLRDLRRVGQMAEAAGEYGPTVRTIELRGKHLGMFRDRIALEGEVKVIDDAARRARIAAILAAARARKGDDA